MASSADQNPGYWREYSNLQHTKHELIRQYLGGWFPKLGSWAGRVLYLDTHAGRGRHLTGQLGSPLVALTTFLGHSHRDRLLQKSEFWFMFIERDPANLRSLGDELKTLGRLPKRVVVRQLAADTYGALADMVRTLKAAGKVLAPAFVFVDPYGFKVPAAVLRELITAGRVELFVNVIWRELDMALAQGPNQPGMAETLDLIFDGSDWRTAINSSDQGERAEQAVALLARQIGARHWTSIRMLGDNGATRYLLVHFTNHDAGRDLMKDCVWKVAPNGGFYVRKSDNPNQQHLISPEPDLAPLRAWVIDKLQDGPTRWQALYGPLRAEPWREAQLNAVIRQMRRGGQIVGEDSAGKFGPTANPLLRIP
jgi:three-Cys-motif partner protein